MDPDVTLHEITVLMDREPTSEELDELVEALTHWIAMGGFVPEGWPLS